jgi:hypothetical protein
MWLIGETRRGRSGRVIPVGVREQGVRQLEPSGSVLLSGQGPCGTRFPLRIGDIDRPMGRARVLPMAYEASAIHPMPPGAGRCYR